MPLVIKMTTDYEFTPADVPSCCAMHDYDIKTVHYGDGSQWYYIGSRGSIWKGCVNNLEVIEIKGGGE